MPKIRNFHETLERDIQRLTAEIKERRAVSEAEKVSEKEIVKKSLEVFSEEKEKPETVPESTVHPHQPPPQFLPSYLTGEEVDKQIKLEVERLIDITFHQGIEKAIKEAKNKPPFIEDAFHDALVDKLLPELKNRGAI